LLCEMDRRSNIFNHCLVRAPICTVIGFSPKRAIGRVV